jgi:hypothetical protein
MNTPSGSDTPRKLSREAIAQIERQIAALDCVPASIDTLAKAVLHIADAFGISVERTTTPKGEPHFKYRKVSHVVHVEPDGIHYHDSYFDVMDGAYEYPGMTTARLAWLICGQPNKFAR